MQGRGHEPRNEGRLQTLEKGRQRILPCGLQNDQLSQDLGSNPVLLGSWLPEQSENEFAVLSHPLCGNLL